MRLKRSTEAKILAFVVGFGIALTLLTFFPPACFGQTFQTLKIGNSSPKDASALLEIQGTTGALLIPRMTTTQKNAIPSLKNGDVVYDTTLNAFNVYQAGAWTDIGAAATWGSIGGTLSNQTDLQTALNLKANLASPTFTGTVTAPTFVGALTGTATNAVNGTTVSTSSNASFYPLFAASSSNGNQPFNLGTGLTFNPSTNTLSTTTFSGAVSGNATTATALASTPTGCAANTYANTIAASGNLGCASITNASTTAVSTNTASTIVLRDGSGNFSAGTISAALTGNSSTATALASTPSGCAANTYANTIASSGNLGCASITNASTTAVSTNTASTIVLRDGSGNFSAGTITATLTGTASGNTTYTANNHGMVVSGSGNTMTVVAPDASTTKVWTSGGASADPSWQTPSSSGMPGTNWASDLTFTTNNMGTLTNSHFYYRRIGDSMHVRASFTVGTTAAAVCSLVIPTYVIDSTKLPSNASGTKVGEATDVGGSSSGLFGSSITSDIFYDGSDTAKLYFAYTSNGSGAFTKNNCNNIWNSNEQVTLNFDIPVTAWAF